MQNFLRCVAVVALLAGCNDSFRADAGPAEEDSGECLCTTPCDDAVQLRIEGEGIADPSQVQIAGIEASCEDAGSYIYCGVHDLPAGEYALTVGALGYADEQIFFSLGGPLTTGCCTCPSTFSRLIVLRRSM